LHPHLADVRTHALQGFRGVLIIRVELEDAVEIVARRATAAKLVIKIGAIAVRHHRFRVELDRLGIVGERCIAGRSVAPELFDLRQV
jgi:hypothetical protein